MNPHEFTRINAPRQHGSALLEALFGILIFSMGILALVGLQASSVKQVSAGKYRTDASLLANELLGEMWVSDRTPTVLATAYASPAGPAYVTWKAAVVAALPGATTYPPVVTVTSVVGSSAAEVHSEVTINMRWKTPNEAAADPAHSYTLVAQIK